MDFIFLGVAKSRDATEGLSLSLMWDMKVKVDSNIVDP